MEILSWRASLDEGGGCGLWSVGLHLKGIMLASSSLSLGISQPWEGSSLGLARSMVAKQPQIEKIKNGIHIPAGERSTRKGVLPGNLITSSAQWQLEVP